MGRLMLYFDARKIAHFSFTQKKFNNTVFSHLVTAGPLNCIYDWKQKRIKLMCEENIYYSAMF